MKTYTNFIPSDSTGNMTNLSNYHIVKCIFGNYEVEIKLNKYDKFIGIKSIKDTTKFHIVPGLPTNESAEDIINKFLSEHEELNEAFEETLKIHKNGLKLLS